MWSATGGDFAGTASASLSIGATTGQYYTWSGGTLVNDVQGWLDNPATNYGWGVMDDAATAQSARRFSSHEQTNNKPVLAVTYTEHSCLHPSTAAVDLDGLGMKPVTTANLGAGEARLYVDKVTGEVTAVPTDLGPAAKRTIVQANGRLHFISVKQFDGEMTSSMILRDTSTDDLVVAKETGEGLSLRVLAPQTDPSDDLALPAKSGAAAADAGGG